MEGWDHHMSVDENEMKRIVQGCKRVFDGIGSEKIIRTEVKIEWTLLEEA